MTSTSTLFHLLEIWDRGSTTSCVCQSISPKHVMPLSFISITLGELRSTCLETAYLHLFMYSLPTALTIATACCTVFLRYRSLNCRWVQNAAARLIMNLEKYSSISPALCELHWLPVNSRIHFKISILTFKSIYALCPSYISDLITIKSKSTYSLRSNDSLYLECPKGNMLPTLGARSFHAAASELWNMQFASWNMWY